MIIDAFMLFDELDLVEIRLNELDSLVDRFLIVESLERHGSAQPKPANLRENWNIMKPFEHKVKYVVLPHLVPEYTGAPSAWKRENYQRNVMLEYAKEISTSTTDILIVSDCDEIPRPSAIRDNLPAITQEVHRLSLDLFFYNVNRFVGVSRDHAGFVTVGPMGYYQREIGFTDADRHHVGLSAIRAWAGTSCSCGCCHPHPIRYRTIPNAGWHFSYFGGLDRIRRKVESFAESSISTDFLKRTDREIATDIAAGQDIYHRGIYAPFTRRDTDDSRLPAHFLNNVERYKHFTEEFFVEQNRELLHG